MQATQAVLATIEPPMALLRCIYLITAFVLGQSGVSARAQAPDVVVLCDVSLHATLVAAGQAWQAKSQVPVRVLTASLEQNAQLVLHGARADILVGIGTERIDKAQQLGAFERGQPVAIGRNPVVLAVRGRVTPRQVKPGDDLGDFLDKGRFGLVDPAIGSAGADARAALAGVGLWPALEARSLGTATTDDLKQMLGDGSVSIAAFYRTDLAGSPALSVAAALAVQAPPVIAALAKDHQSPNANSFLTYLTGEGQAVLQQGGLEGP